MVSSDFARAIAKVTVVAACASLLSACGGGMSLGGMFGGSSSPPPPDPPPVAELPASIRAEEIVGRWGLAAYHKPEDRARTEANARTQCRQPYVINAGANGGVIMHLADEAQPQELRLKGGPGGKNYIGPPGPGGAEKDREILSFDGRVMTTRFVDPDANSRYGTMIYVRCAPRA
ncbi:hypothetical protein X566_13220 [Afipia sp. P52-10]|jgi:hypothetical protein|uniref:hypothetical protein n=1 Tax=Afipia sp. P52-10 TaxID=1429916 RepID=UPI0003DF1DEC|nr:hypothetical protein [Afipia sp. P52-10]ETR78514.1 hypothetical protein X566_13220 [Afipia sp. P52-10]